MSYDVMAGDVIEFLDYHRIARADIIGHSMGGKTAIRIAQRASERLNRLVVVDIAPGSTEALHAETIQALRAVDLSSMHTREEVGRALSHEIPDRRVRQFLLTNLRRDSAGRLSWKLNLEAIAEHHDALLGPMPEGHPVAIPTLFVRGSRSTHLKVDDEVDIRRRFQNVWIVSIDGAGHWVHADRPEQFLDVVRRFLETGNLPS
jgi:pimeloyl-ACP methyl ester carboxylesterase